MNTIPIITTATIRRSVAPKALTLTKPNDRRQRNRLINWIRLVDDESTSADREKLLRRSRLKLERERRKEW